MKTKTVKELLEFLLTEITKPNTDQNEHGICFWLNHVYEHEIINIHEYFILRDIINENKPSTTLNSQFHVECDDTELGYWWAMSRPYDNVIATHTHREEFLKFLIRKENQTTLF